MILIFYHSFPRDVNNKNRIELESYPRDASIRCLLLLMVQTDDEAEHKKSHPVAAAAEEEKNNSNMKLMDYYYGKALRDNM